MTNRSECVPKARYARQSFDDPYLCEYPWPADCFVQCGGRGLVFTATQEKVRAAFTDPEVAGEVAAEVLSAGPTTTPGAYRTAFFEAFPEDPKTFLRGEGETIEDAEKSAWEKLEHYRACADNHATFDRRGYKNGGGFCVSCGLFRSYAFERIGDSWAATTAERAAELKAERDERDETD